MIMRKRSLAVMLVVAACGPRPGPPPIPMLPGDGDTHVAKPEPVKPPTAAEAAPQDKDLIAAPAPRSPVRPGPPRPLELPPIEDHKELEAAVRFSAQDQIPMPLDSAVLDFQPLGIVETDNGPRQRVLIEGRAKKDAGELSGRTDNNRVVNFGGPERLIGEFAEVLVTSALPHSLRGEIA